MTTTEQIIKLNDDYQKGILRVSHSEYLKSYNKLAAKAKREVRASNKNSLANQLKEFGAKVTKEKFGYVYNGINFSVEVYLDGCVTNFWTTSWFNIEDESIAEELNVQFDTKKELVYYLLNTDKNISNK